MKSLTHLLGLAVAVAFGAGCNWLGFVLLAGFVVVAVLAGVLESRNKKLAAS